MKVKLMSELRLKQLKKWLDSHFNQSAWTLKKLAGDASFRCYFRLFLGNETFVVMDAPPENENCYPYCQVTEILTQAEVRVPHILACDLAQGFLLLSDFGDEQYLSLLNENSVEHLYQIALKALLQFQIQVKPEITELPKFDATLLQRELQLFPDWFLVKHLEFKFSTQETDSLQSVFDYLIKSALEQPQIFVHRDYHSRNLMRLPEEQVGIIDFQDAVWGPITYDLVSLLRDCYIAWPNDQVDLWLRNYYKKLLLHDLLNNISYETFKKWFDLMGVQRHLKVVGIFTRLCYRDGKFNYMNDIPRILNYLLEVCIIYPELQFLFELLQKIKILLEKREIISCAQ